MSKKIGLDGEPYSEHKVHWFGEPWPTPEQRAPICEDPLYRIETPVPPARCVQCGQMFIPSDQGVRISFLSEDPTQEWAYYHIRCFMEMVLGPEAARLVDLVDHVRNDGITYWKPQGEP